jgi:cobaltochelatase CobT
MAQQQRAWEFDLEEGILDVARLARVVATPTLSLSYKRERDADFRDTVVTLLIDNSGSMRGRRSRSPPCAPTSWPARWSAAP